MVRRGDIAALRARCTRTTSALRIPALSTVRLLPAARMEVQSDWVNPACTRWWTRVCQALTAAVVARFQVPVTLGVYRPCCLSRHCSGTYRLVRVPGAAYRYVARLIVAGVHRGSVSLSAVVPVGAGGGVGVVAGGGAAAALRSRESRAVLMVPPPQVSLCPPWYWWILLPTQPSGRMKPEFGSAALFQSAIQIWSGRAIGLPGVTRASSRILIPDSALE